MGGEDRLKLLRGWRGAEHRCVWSSDGIQDSWWDARHSDCQWIRGRKSGCFPQTGEQSSVLLNLFGSGRCNKILCLSGAARTTSLFARSPKNMAMIYKNDERRARSMVVEIHSKISVTVGSEGKRMIIPRERVAKLQSIGKIFENPTKCITVCRRRIDTIFSCNINCIGKIRANSTASKLETTNCSLIRGIGIRKAVLRWEKT